MSFVAQSSIAQRLLIQIEDNQLTLGWQRGAGMPRVAEPVAFDHPFDGSVLAVLRWYLEDYLKFPYGIEPEKAEAVEGQMRDWGQALFGLVFNRQSKAWEFFQEAVREGLDQCELAVVCDDPAVLNLPWELLFSPDEGYVAPLLAGMYRSLSGQKVRAALPELPQDRLNVLLVIARPYGERDIALQTIARPVLAAVQGLGDQVNLKVLRPPTFAALEAELNRHKGFYHIVHFDGHGSFDAAAQGLQSSFGEEGKPSLGQGVLVFEQLDGSSEIVTAEKLAQSLQNCRVPLFLLNACKSGQAGEDAFSSVAGQLVRLGAKGVVAMAYSVYAVAAKYFIGRVYGELVRGATVAEAVAAGRREVLNQSGRPSPKGELSLQDWMVPVLYQQEPYRPFVPRPEAVSAAAGFGALMDGVAAAEPGAAAAAKLVGFPEVGAYGFVGRDYDLLRLERQFREIPGQAGHVALLKGMGGVGKTALAQGFATWLMETQGREAAFFTSFETGAGLSQVVNQIGRALGGDRFAALMAEQQQAVVMQYLREHPVLLVWDNFEPVNGFPAGNVPLLSEDERGALRRFLKDLRGGASWVLITSRREERWLDCGYGLVELRGLGIGDAELLAAQILAGAGVERAQLPGEYVELLKLLGGHPLALRVVLPLLKQQSPVAVMEALRLGLELVDGDSVDGEEEGRDRSLTASLDYSFGRLSERARRHLPFLALFCDRVIVGVLDSFSANPDEADGQAYRAVFGENLGQADWVALLEEAAQAGIVELLGGEIYKIHPALPWFLRRHVPHPSPLPPSARLRERGEGTEPGAQPSALVQLEAQLLVFYASLAGTYEQKLVGQAEQAMFVLGVEEPNLLHQLRRAELGEQWAEAQYLLQALGDMYGRTGRKAEFGALRRRALGRVGEHLAAVREKGRDAFNFWMYLRGVDANELMAAADLDGAGAVYQEILDELLSLEDDSVLGSIAVQYHQLGRVAEEQRRFEEAIANYNKALKIFEDAGDFYQAASDYHQLGVVAQEQRRFEDAIANYNKALKIKEDAGDLYAAASDYHQLGRVAQEQRRFEEAIANYNKALKIYEDAGDFYQAADEYHQLGRVAQEQRRYEEAIANYNKALKIYEDAGDFYQAASEYHQLGRVAEEQRRFEDAIANYNKALKIYEDAGDFYNAADEYHQLGMVAQEQRRFEEAIANYNKALKIREDAGDFYTAGNSYAVIALLAQEQSQPETAIGNAAKALEIFMQFNDEYKVSAVAQILAKLLQTLGPDPFQTTWQTATGSPCPPELLQALQQALED